MIRFDEVHKTYKSGVDALRGVSFEIDDGEFVFIIGKSGSGKSTLMKCITCEENPTEGAVYIDNFDISHMSRKLVPVLRRQLGMIYQDFRLIESKTVFENVAFAGEIIGMPRKSLNQTVQLMLNIVGLKDKGNAYPQELSGGEQQRVAIARAMVGNPKIIVADEPTGNLDPETSENIMALLLDINKSGTTVLVCTHDSNLVDRMKKRVIEIDAGLVARDQELSSYSGDNVTVIEPPKPVEKTAAEVGFSFGDDPNFEHDTDYYAGTDEDTYIPSPVAFGLEEVKPAEPKPEEPAPLPIPEELFEEASIQEAAETSKEPVRELIEVPAEPASEEDSPEEVIEEVAAELVFGTGETPASDTTDNQDNGDSEDSDNSDDGEEESSEDWLNKIVSDVEDSDIDLDISEDD